MSLTLILPLSEGKYHNGHDFATFLKAPKIQWCYSFLLLSCISETASIFRAAVFLLRVLFLCYLTCSVSPCYFLHDCKSESTCKHQDSVLHSFPCSAPIAKWGAEPPVAEYAGIPAVNLQLLRREAGGISVQICWRWRMARNNWIGKRGGLGGLEDSCLCKQLASLILPNQSAVSCILQNWY